MMVQRHLPMQGKTKGVAHCQKQNTCNVKLYTRSPGSWSAQTALELGCNILRQLQVYRHGEKRLCLLWRWFWRLPCDFHTHDFFKPFSGWLAPHVAPPTSASRHLFTAAPVSHNRYTQLAEGGVSWLCCTCL